MVVWANISNKAPAKQYTIKEAQKAFCEMMFRESAGLHGWRKIKQD